MSVHQNHNLLLLTTNKSFENVGNFEYLGTRVKKKIKTTFTKKLTD